jgi:predicted  nucleic acid-binding Zn-ribbon protein
MSRTLTTVQKPTVESVKDQRSLARVVWDLEQQVQTLSESQTDLEQQVSEVKEEQQQLKSRVDVMEDGFKDIQDLTASLQQSFENMTDNVDSKINEIRRDHQHLMRVKAIVIVAVVFCIALILVIV